MKATEEPPAPRARRLVRSVPKVALGTLLPDGAPYASMAIVACDHDAAPLLLLSQLSDHTKNAARDARVSLLFDATESVANPQAGARVTVQGTLVRTDERRHRERYLARHPAAAHYAGFSDFAMYRVVIERAHLIGGFAQAYWLDGGDVRFDASGSADLAAGEAGILEHMNSDHRDAVRLYATRLLRQADGDWTMTGIDPEGADLRCGARVARLEFGQTIADPAGARKELIRLIERARGADH